MIISYSIGGEEAENIIAAYNHSRERHYQEVKAKIIIFRLVFFVDTVMVILRL